MPSTISEFTFEELTESGRGQIAEDGTATRVFKIAWTNLGDFVKALKGYWQAVNTETWTFVPPDEHPDWPGMFCVDVQYAAMGAATGFSNGKSAWEFAKVTATYNAARMDFGSVQPQDIIEEELEFGFEHHTLPADSYETTDDSTSVGQEQTKIVPILTYTVTMRDVPNLPGATFSGFGPIPIASDNVGLIYSALGTVNNANFKGAGPGQMLFLGAQARRKTNVFGPQNWDISLKFLFRPVSWNKVFVSDKGDFVEVQSKTGGNKIYTASNHAALLPK